MFVPIAFEQSSTSATVSAGHSCSVSGRELTHACRLADVVIVWSEHKAVAPKVDDFPRLVDGMGDFMRQKYDWSADVAKLKMPVMLAFGDAGMVRPEHEVKFFQLLGGGLKDAGWNRENMPKNRLAIIPDATHYETGASARVAETVRPFLDRQPQKK
jgi:pimeloyl-ACP methyl ester carboxylesterase